MLPKTHRSLAWAAFALLILVMAVSAIKQLREPDLWWQLRTGEWILEHGEVMHEDVFSYTHEGTDWINVKWGFEVLMSMFDRMGGPEFMLILQLIANLLLIWLFYKLFLLLRWRMKGMDDALPTLRFLLFGFLLFLGTEFRFNGRPEMVSHVMTMVFLLLLLRNRYRDDKWVFALIPLQVLWANLHEAYGTGLVMVVAMAGAAWFEYLFLKKMQTDMPKRLTIVAILVALAPALHPGGPQMILHPFEIFSQVGENKYTTELLSFQNSEYWQKEAYINIFIFIIAIIGLFTRYRAEQEKPKKKKSRRPLSEIITDAIANVGLGYVVLLALFFYLSLTAYRNIPFSILVAAPLAAAGRDVFTSIATDRRKGLQSNTASTAGYVIFIGIGIAFYIMLATGYYYEKVDDNRDKYGLKVDPVMNPIGAAEYIKEHKLQGRAFSDFLVPNYLLWKLQPEFKTFIDLRDLDIFPAEFFDKFAYLNYRPEEFAALDSQYNFSYAVLYRANFETLHRYFAAQQDWALVYADPVAALYVKDLPQHRQLIDRFGGKDVFYTPAEVQSRGISKAVSNIFWPPYNAEDTLREDFDLIAADYYRVIGRYDMALQRAARSAGNHIADWKGYQALGDIYLQMYSGAGDSLGAQYIKKASEAYSYALVESKEAVGALVGQARIEIMNGNYTFAVQRLKQAAEADKKNKNVYLLLAQAQTGLAAQDPSGARHYLQERVDYLEKAYDLDRDDLYVQFYLGLGNAKLQNCDKAEKYLMPLLNFPGVPEKDRQQARGLLIQCGVRL